MASDGKDRLDAPIGARFGWVVAITVVAGLLFAAAAAAHIERTSYWPDPAVDTSVSPTAGGKVPEPRSLRSALNQSLPGETRVVCKGASLRDARRSITSVRRDGFVLRPSQPREFISGAQAAELEEINSKLFERCAYHSIQKAVFESGNNDRVVVMPGLYQEMRSRAKPTNDPDCEQYEETSENGTGAASYEYQFRCPNDQSLIYIGGRDLGPGDDPPPLEDRHGIPNLGPCIRCNFQLEGSGPRPDDVIIENGDPASGDGLDPSPAKDVIIRADRADGLVLSNFKVRHSREHGVYIHETDGYMVNRVHSYYNFDYGYLQFTDDHGVVRDCDTKGNGDSGIYPGAAAETGEQTVEPTERLNQKVARCDSHHNVLGYSGTMGNAVHIVNNHFYDNATGIATDSFFAGGHPGHPQDSDRIEGNKIYSNNFNPYTYDTDVDPAVPLPVGTGILIAGGNNNDVINNRIWDNWRRGTMLLAVPDALADPELVGTSTSFRDRQFGNVMGVGPGGGSRPNGVDFWWDEFPAPDTAGGSAVVTENCWFDNGAYTSDPPPSPVAGASVPGFLPEDCATSFGNSAAYSTKAPVLADCAMWSHGEDGDDRPLCDWFDTPPPPGSAAAAEFRAAEQSRQQDAVQDGRSQQICELLAGSFSCDPFDRPSSP